jgi:hypothetical protein
MTRRLSGVNEEGREEHVVWNGTDARAKFGPSTPFPSLEQLAPTAALQSGASDVPLGVFLAGYLPYLRA